MKRALFLVNWKQATNLHSPAQLNFNLLRYLSGKNQTRHYSENTQARVRQWSYEQGDSSFCGSLIGKTIGQLLEEKTEQDPDKVVFKFRHQDRQLNFSQLLEKSDQLAAGLLTLGVKRGDRVGIWAGNCEEWIIAQYGTARIGSILVNINPAYQSVELLYALKYVDIKVLIMAETFKGQSYMDILTRIQPDILGQNQWELNLDKLPQLKNIILISSNKIEATVPFKEVLEMGTTEERTHIHNLQNELQFDDPINIQFTSGTTGHPKGATLTHHNILNNSRLTGMTLGFHKEEASICVPVPLYHCFGMVLGSMQSITNGALCVFPSEAYSSSTVLKAVHEERCVALYGTPVMFIDILNHPQRSSFDLKSLRTGIMAGSPCPVEVMKKVVEELNMKDITVGYGSTELSPISNQSRSGCSLEKRVSTVGQAHPHCEIKIADENNRIVPRNVPGEVCVRGYGVMLSYWNDPEGTKNVITPDRWYHTGDIGKMDEEGYLSIVGRLRDIINRGGENIYPLEVEQFLYTHPKVIDVQVIGVPHARLGEEVCAWIKLKEGVTCTDQEIKEFCKGQIADFHTPKVIRFVKEYPLTVTGKVMKYMMRKQEVERFAQENAND